MLTSLQNPLIKQIRKLQRAKYRHEQNLFLIEGTHPLETACEVNCSLNAVCCTPEWEKHHPQLWKKAAELAYRAEIVTPEVLKAIATTVNPDGVMATAVRTGARKPIPSQLSLGLVLERLQDPGNLGTIIRTAVATQVDGLWLSESSVDFAHPKVLRSSAGEWFRLPMTVSSDLREVISNYQAQGVQIVASLPQAGKTYWELDWTKPSLILLGNEGAGLSEDLVSLTDSKVRIPLRGGVESLNVAIAAALLLYEVQRQRR